MVIAGALRDIDVVRFGNDVDEPIGDRRNSTPALPGRALGERRSNSSIGVVVSRPGPKWYEGDKEMDELVTVE